MPTRLPVDIERFADFVTTQLTRDHVARLWASDLYAAYANWCERHRYFVISQTLLGRMMKEHGFEKSSYCGRIVYRQGRRVERGLCRLRRMRMHMRAVWSFEMRRLCQWFICGNVDGFERVNSDA